MRIVIRPPFRSVRDLAELMPEGVATRIDLTLASSTSSVARWTASGDLLHVHPGVVMLPRAAQDPLARARAATLWAKAPLSHRSALALWEVVAPSNGLLHVTVPADRYPRRTSGVLVHRTTVHLPTTQLRGIPVTTLGRSLVDTWDWAHRSRKGRRHGGEPIARQAVIECIRGRRIHVGALRAASATLRVHAGKTALTTLLDLVEQGCGSELEIWGATHVLPGPPRLPQWVQQYRVRLGDARSVRLMPPTRRLASRSNWTARPSTEVVRPGSGTCGGTRLSPALGWVVLRFSYARLMADPEGCRREIEAVVLAPAGQPLNRRGPEPRGSWASPVQS